MFPIHAIETGRLRANRTFWRGEGWSSLLRRPESYEFPAHAFVLEHPEGTILIDTGFAAGVKIRRIERRMVPVPVSVDHDALAGVGDVRTVVLTHLDWDHAGGVGAFPDAEILVPRPELEFAAKLPGRLRYQPRLWPESFEPAVYDLDSEPFGPFDASRPITAAGDVRLVPLPGHSAGQVGVVVQHTGGLLLFCADHTLRRDWFLEDRAAGRLIQSGVFFRDQAIETSRRIHALMDSTPTVLLPSHDSETPARLRSALRSRRERLGTA